MTNKINSESAATYNTCTAFTAADIALDSENKIITQAKEILLRRMKKTGIAVTSPEVSRDYLMMQLADLEHEVFSCLFLNNKHQVIAFEILFRGTIDGASIYPREVVKEALKHNAAAVIFAHNHPSGVPEPSKADRNITAKLKDALALVDVRVLDHIIIGGTEYASLAERRLL